MNASNTTASSPFPGLDGFRLVAAVAVLFSHAFLIAEGNEDGEPLVRLLGPHRIAGLYAVFVFFMISGFLLARALDLRPNLIQFVINRTLRIFPGFVFCTMITVLLIGPLVSPQALLMYLAQPEAYSYLTSSLLCLCDSWQNPFEFSKDPAFASVKNGSLWSLSFEAISYILILWTWAVVGTRGRVAAVLVTLSLATMVSPTVYNWTAGSYTLPYFASGAVMYVVYKAGGTNVLAATALILLSGASQFFGMPHYVFALLGSYPLVHFAGNHNIFSRFSQRFGDFSYGIYLFGWPVEATANAFLKTESGWILFLVSLPLVMCTAAASWWLCERPFLNVKVAVSKACEVGAEKFGTLLLSSRRE